MERKDRIDLAGAVLLVSTAVLMGINQVMIKMVNAGLQRGTRLDSSNGRCIQLIAHEVYG